MKICVCRDSEVLPSEFSKLSFDKKTDNVSAAVDSACEGDEIYICPGTYIERVTIKTPGIKLIGVNPEVTVISLDLHAYELMEDGRKRGTFRSYTMFIDTHRVFLEGLTIANTAGDGRIVGQALALYAEGEHLHFVNCRFLGHQDTIFTGPLPDEEVEHGGFVGPKEKAPRINGRQWYERCYIEGDVDFIFGGATALFTDCTICSLGRDMEPNGYVTAPSTPKNQKIGYVFRNCSFTSKGCEPETVYISRPWREYAKAVFIECSFGPHIKTEFVHDWNKPIAHKTAFYAEYPGKPGRANWVYALSSKEAREYTQEKVYEKE